MATEDLTGTGKHIDDLVATNPAATDSVSDGDEHIRGVKNVLKNTFPNLTGAVTATHTELNYVDGVTSSIQTQIDNLDPLPSQTGHAGKYLTTDATNASWATLDTDANTTTKGLYEMANTISSNYSITSGNNALTAGPITINTGISVTIPTGSTWVIA